MRSTSKRMPLNGVARPCRFSRPWSKWQFEPVHVAESGSRVAAQQFGCPNMMLLCTRKHTSSDHPCFGSVAPGPQLPDVYVLFRDCSWTHTDRSCASE